MGADIDSRAAAVLASRAQPTNPLPWVMFQSWQNLLFMDWQVPADVLRRVVPSKMELDSYGGTTWLTQIPMHMVDVHIRDLPPIPGTATFPEINFRTYVIVNGVPGIVFLSIDADSAFAAWAAETFFKLPYVDAKASFDRDADGTCHLESHRPASSRFKEAQFRGHYRPTGSPKPAAPGSLDEWLTARLHMFVQLDDGIVLRGDIHHPPWQIQTVEATIEQNTIPQAGGLDVDPRAPDRIAYAERTDTLCWPMIPVEL